MPEALWIALWQSPRRAARSELQLWKPMQSGLHDVLWIVDNPSRYLWKAATENYIDVFNAHDPKGALVRMLFELTFD
jgi:hypothetical protein